MSPTSLKLTFKAIRNARAANDLVAALKQEFRLAQACGRGQDMMEGIRAAIVDKDRNPKWSPARLEDVPSKLVDAHFDDPASEALELALG
jgi:enoyl-CoA hydratase